MMPCLEERCHQQCWAPRSERLVTAAPHGHWHGHWHWHTTAFVAGLRNTGLVAPLVLGGPMNGPAFLAYVEQFLAPTLRPGDVVVIGQAGRPQGGGRRRNDQGGRRQRPLFATLLARPNPIEQVFAKLKPLLRAVAAGTKETPWGTIGQLLDRFSTDECRNYFTNSGYEFT